MGISLINERDKKLRIILWGVLYMVSHFNLSETKQPHFNWHRVSSKPKYCETSKSCNRWNILFFFTVCGLCLNCRLFCPTRQKHFLLPPRSAIFSFPLFDMSVSTFRFILKLNSLVLFMSELNLTSLAMRCNDAVPLLIHCILIWLEMSAKHPECECEMGSHYYKSYSDKWKCNDAV